MCSLFILVLMGVLKYMFFVYISADGCVIVFFVLFILVRMGVLYYVFFVYISANGCVILCVLCLY